MERPIGYPIPVAAVDRLPVLPERAQRLLANGEVLAYRFTAYQSNLWPVHLLPGVDVCVARPEGGNAWLTQAEEIFDEGIEGIGDAILALTQPPPFPPAWPINTWTKAGFVETAFHHRPKPKDNALVLHLVATAAGIVLEQKGWHLVDHHGPIVYDHVWCTTRGLATARIRRNDPPAVVLVQNTGLSAHRRLGITQEVQASFDAWVATLPACSPTHGFLPGWSCLAPPSPDEVDALFSHA